MSRASASLQIDAIGLELADGPPLRFPLKGVSDAWGRAEQPENTTPDCLNVVPYDLQRRGRGGKRPGFIQQCATSLGGATVTPFVQGLIEHVAESASGVRSDYLIAMSGGKAYVGTSSAAVTLGTGSAFSASRYISMTAIDGKIYFGDGAGIFVLDAATRVVSAYAASAGVAPTNPRIFTTYRRRLMMSGFSDGNPQNFVASRVGAPTDLNYGATDPARAFAGNEARSGQVGDPITAMIPLGDDALLFGCDHSLWMMNGDIAAGGRIDVLDRGIGISSSAGWCFDPMGNLYFVGTSGFYRLARGSYAAEWLSREYDSFFCSLPANVTHCQWDAERHGCWIFRTDSPTCTWYDGRTGGFFPQQLPALLTPSASLVYGYGTSRVILIGNTGAGTGDAKLFAPSQTAAGDNGSAINNYVYMGFGRPAGIARESKLLALSVILGETPAGFIAGNVGCSYTIQTGKTPNDAYASPTQTTAGTFSGPGRQPLARNRLKGSAFFLKLSSNDATTTWSVDEAAPRYVPAGRVR